MWKTLSILFLLANCPSAIYGRKSSGGGSARGSSPVRSGGPPGNLQPHPSGGFNQPGGFNRPGQGPPQGGFGGPQGGHFGGPPAGGFNQGGFNRGGFQGGHPGSFGMGSGPGSMSRGSVFKTALAGAALGTVGGLVTYELGKAILHSADRPFHYDNRNYYFDQQNYKGRPGELMCSMPLQNLINANPVSTTTQAPPTADATTPSPNAPTTTPTPDQLLAQVQYPNGTRPKDIVWSCKQGAEVCCGTDCCPVPEGQYAAGAEKSRGGSGLGGIIFVIIIVLLLMCCCCALMAYKFCRSAFDFVMPSSQNNAQQQPYSNPNQYSNQNTYYDDDPNKYQGGYGQQQPQSYPMQPYPQQGYQQGYAPPPQYPAYPQQKY